ncbi:MAG: hypothetical protein U9R43_12990 [Thermodesulfobacteriota bacterium]|nr:hypothetical protein [Thermodesulfobacteriota bacterium]
MALNVVSNAGPLIVFSKLNVLHLLKELYGRVEFPFSVYRETVNPELCVRLLEEIFGPDPS